MKKVLLIAVISFVLFSLYSVAPYTADGKDRIVISYEDDSDYKVLEDALRESVSLEWYEKYTTLDSILIDSSFNLLSSFLPVDSFYMTEEKNNAISAIMADGKKISFTFLDGKINAIRQIN